MRTINGWEDLQWQLCRSSTTRIPCCVLNIPRFYNPSICDIEECLCKLRMIRMLEITETTEEKNDRQKDLLLSQKLKTTHLKLVNCKSVPKCNIFVHEKLELCECNPTLINVPANITTLIIRNVVNPQQIELFLHEYKSVNFLAVDSHYNKCISIMSLPCSLKRLETGTNVYVNCIVNCEWIGAMKQPHESFRRSFNVSSIEQSSSSCCSSDAEDWLIDLDDYYSEEENRHERGRTGF